MSLPVTPRSLLGVDEAIQRHSFDSLTQKATARFKSSRSIRSRAFSRSNSPSRSRSSEARPSRSPRLISSMAYPVAQSRVVDPQLVGDLTYRLARSADDIYRVSFELIRELSPRSFPSQQDSFPARSPIVGDKTRSLWKCPASGGNSMGCSRQGGAGRFCRPACGGCGINSGVVAVRGVWVQVLQGVGPAGQAGS